MTPQEIIAAFESAPDRNVTGKDIADYAAALEDVGRIDHAMHVHKQAMMADGTVNSAIAYVAALTRLGHRDAEAVDALHQKHGHPFFLAAKSEMALNDGDWKTGFSLCRNRWVLGGDDLAGRIGLPFWDGGDIDGRLIVVNEQGLGEEILFSSCFNDIPPAIIGCDQRLMPIFQRSFPRHVFVHRSTLRHYHGAAVIDAMSLMGILGRTGNMAPWLIPDSGKASAVKGMISDAMPGEKTAGLSWFSSRKGLSDAKSIPHEAARRLADSGAKFFNLQYGAILDDVKRWEADGFPVYAIDGIDCTNDLDGVLALIEALDVVVTCSNTVAHMAGAIGKRTILLAPNRFRLWYWGTSDRSPWYPSVEIVRNTGDWRDSIAAANRLLTSSVG